MICNYVLAMDWDSFNVKFQGNRPIVKIGNQGEEWISSLLL